MPEQITAPSENKENGLADIQKWFANVITQPLGKNDTISKCAPSGSSIADEADIYIAPGPTLRPHQRMEIYNQQYWWRLLNHLHTNFPLLIRLLGYRTFNALIGVPFLTDCPPKHWSLVTLGEQLAQWILKSYKRSDKLLMHEGAALDYAFTASFVATSIPAPDFVALAAIDGGNHLLQSTLFLQPHIHLFSWKYDLLAFRDAILKQPVEYWQKHRLPRLPLGKLQRFVIYRNFQNQIAWRHISEAEFFLLKLLKNGTTLQDGCDCIENERSDLYADTAENLPTWIQNWASAKWLFLDRAQQSAL